MTGSKRIWFIYGGGFLLAMHYASVAYVNSSLIKKFIGESSISILYVLGSILSIALLALTPGILRKFGNTSMLLFFIVLEMIAVFGLGSSSAAIIILLLFLLHQSAESILYLSLDISLENEIGIEGTTGRKRGLFLTAQNIAWVLSPLLISFLIQVDDFSNVYFLSGLALVLLFIIGGLFIRRTTRVESKSTHIVSALLSLKNNWDEAKIIGAQFMLHFYFAWMLIYLPLLLYHEIGFGWDKIGLILTIMLVPYLLFEFPAGLLADRKLGEKEILTTGFIIMAVSTFLIPFLTLPIFGLWAALLFITRIGASMVEISSESYFFKRVKSEDSGLISLFRMARPISFIIAPLVTILVLQFTTYSGSFLVLSVLTLMGLLFIPKKDTK